MTTQSQPGDINPLKLAVAIAILRSRLNQNRQCIFSEADALRWKQKSKERKSEILNLQEELKKVQEEKEYDPFSEFASCRCHFYGDLGKLSAKDAHVGGEDSHKQFDDILHRRFLRQVRWKQRKKNADHSVRQVIGLRGEDEMEQLSLSVDFLLELLSTVSQEGKCLSFATLSHQAVDFILASLKSLLSNVKDNDRIEEIINGLIGRLIRRLSIPIEKNGSKNLDSSIQSHIQHLVRKLGKASYIGQRILLLVSQKITAIADRLLTMDPFDSTFLDLHNFMFWMIQLIEFLISDYLLIWASSTGFENMLFEGWVLSFLQAQEASKLLESRNALYILYLDRVKGQIVKILVSGSFPPSLLPDDVLDTFLADIKTPK